MSEAVAPASAGARLDLVAMRRRMVIDAWLRLGVGVPLMVLGGLIWFAGNQTSPRPSIGPFTADPWLGMLLLLSPWAAGTMISAVGLQRIRQASQQMIARELGEAEASLATVRRLWPLSRRMHLLHLRSLADLRHLQGRHDQVVLLARELLTQDGRLFRSPVQYAELLLLWVESALECGWLADAYEGLCRLGGVSLGLEQRLGRLLLQTRYELVVAADQAVLRDWARKARLAELLPQPMCGELHGYLAAAATRAGDLHAAEWLSARARLLSPGSMRRIFRAAGLGRAVDTVQRPSAPVDNLSA